MFNTILLTIVVFVPLERLFAIRPQQHVFRAGWQMDSLYLLINPFLSSLGINALLFGALLITSWLIPRQFQSWVASMPFWIQFPALLILSDLVIYFMHRLCHAVPWLWKFHAVHHSSEELDWLASYRVHPIDQILIRGVSLIPLFAFGFSGSAVVTYIFLYQWQSLLIHSNVKFEIGPFARIFASPRFHHWHHANHLEALNKNFAAQLSILDVLFGTLHLPGREMPQYYGTDTPVPRRYLGQIAFPFVPTSTQVEIGLQDRAISITKSEKAPSSQLRPY